MQAFSIGVGGLPGIISIKSQFWLAFLAAMAAAIVIPFALTLLVGKKETAAKGSCSHCLGRRGKLPFTNERYMYADGRS